jgi:hypothetical protein
MGDGRWEMGDGRWEMGDGRWEMEKDREVYEDRSRRINRKGIEDKGVWEMAYGEGEGRI